MADQANPERERLEPRHRSGCTTPLLAAGALGGKLTGAGGGGFLLLFVPPDRQACVKAALEGLIHVPFRFEFAGSQVLFADPEAEYQPDTDQSSVPRRFREAVGEPPA